MIYRQSINHLFRVILLAYAINSLLITAFGQTPTPTPKSIPAPNRGRTAPAIPEPNRGRLITEKEEAPRPEEALNKSREALDKYKPQPSKGALVLWAVTGANVTLAPLRSNRKGPAKNYDLVEGRNKLILTDLIPGEYHIRINHPDYASYTDTIKIIQGQPFPLLPHLVSKYGFIHVVSAPAGAKILLDGKEPDPTNTKSTDEKITISRVPVGKHKLEISKEDYDPRSIELEVAPDESAPVSGELKVATITVIFDSEPGAKLYVDDEERGVVDPTTRKAKVSLPPRSYRMRLTKDGYKEWAEEMMLSLENRLVNKSIPLAPITTSNEGAWNPSLREKKWFPVPVPAWEFGEAGALIGGNQVTLLATEPWREFSIYKNFDLVFDAQLTSDKGLAWIVRAKDPNNYYLFVLSAKPKKLSFYLCQNGKCDKEIDSQPVSEPIDIIGESITIHFEARDNRFKTRLSIASIPESSSKPITLGSFTEATLTQGGVGFIGKDGLGMLLQNFIVTPK